MEKRVLGGTGIEVTDVGMGCWAIGGASFRDGIPSGWSGANIDESLAVVKAAWDTGVTFYDTADAYGRGKSEVLVGYGLQDIKDQVVIATKAGNSLAGPGQNFAEPYLRGALDASLTRLELASVDVFQLHGPPVEEMTDELFALMAELKADGKFRSWGVSISSTEEGIRAIEGGAEVIQLVYNILSQDVGRQILPLAQGRGVGVIARVPLASGWLTGKYGAGTRFPDSDHRSRKFDAERAARIAAQVDQLSFLLDEADTLAEAALRFTLSHPAVSTVIPGAKNREQLAQNVRASGKALSDGALQRIEELFG
ncbi:aldo/keto reductase [Candidatus Latescibacterota bacterium]